MVLFDSLADARMLWQTLLGAALTLSGVVATQWVFWRIESQRERSTWKTLLYAERLGAHQKGYWWITGLAALMTDLDAGRARTDGSAMYESARDWWDSTNFYLDDRSRNSLIAFVEHVGATVEKSMLRADDWMKLHRAALLDIQAGIRLELIDVSPRGRGAESATGH